MKLSGFSMLRTLLIGISIYTLGFESAQAQTSGGSGGSPFGISMGQKMSSLTIIKNQGDDFYEVKVPVPNEEFEAYMVVANADAGVCKISAIGKTHSNDDYGSVARLTFGSFHDILGGKYGNSKDLDFIDSNALWKEDKEWSWSIYKKERHLVSFWDRDERSTLPAAIRAISLEVLSVKPGENYISLHYEFSNADQCAGHRQQTQASGL